tara:strand:+ start:551 stop:895 length:345 start_codon:yes stop_codon:yes gene_type:complete
MSDFLSNLQNSLITGFISHDFKSYENLQPKILINNKDSEKKILSSIIDNLMSCDEFSFAVAFLTSGGVQSLHNTFKDLIKEIETIATNKINIIIKKSFFLKFDFFFLKCFSASS